VVQAAVARVAGAAQDEATHEWNFKTGDEIAPNKHAQQLLGGGERYEAYVAWNAELLAPTVVKILRPDRRSPRARAALAHEADLLAGLQHPGLLRLFEADVEGPRPFMEVEFLDGPRLSTLIRRHGRLVPEQLFPLARHLSSTLHYLHRQRIVHLDVKARNIIMGPVPRLIDLSVAHCFDELPAITGTIGTDAYMAPEQCDPARLATIGPAADVWGLGVTLYEASSKRRPFPAGRREADGSERFPQLVNEPAALPAEVPAVLKDLVFACLAPDPSARPSPAQLFDAFDELAARVGVGRVSLR
jgi:eukaryotic-like serine/threonine-protein kinase